MYTVASFLMQDIHPKDGKCNIYRNWTDLNKRGSNMKANIIHYEEWLPRVFQTGNSAFLKLAQNTVRPPQLL